jgi:hypothetical protein
MLKFSVRAVLALGLVAQVAAAQIACAADAPSPKPPDGDKPPTPPPPPPASNFNTLAIPPLKDGGNYWPGYLVTYSWKDGGQMEVCYIIARSADLGGGTLVGTLQPNQQVGLLCSNVATLTTPPPPPAH